MRGSRGSSRVDAVQLDRLGDVGFETGGVLADAFVAGVAEGWMGVVDLLHHGADETGELRVVRHGEVLCGSRYSRGGGRVGRGGSGRRRRQRRPPVTEAPMIGCLEGEIFFAFEVMEEAAFGEFGGFADVFDACCGIAFGADDLEGGVEKLCFGVVFGVGHFHTHWLVWKCTHR